MPLLTLDTITPSFPIYILIIIGRDVCLLRADDEPEFFFTFVFLAHPFGESFADVFFSLFFLKKTPFSSEQQIRMKRKKFSSK